MTGVLRAVDDVLRAEVLRYPGAGAVAGVAAGVVVDDRLAWSCGAGVASQATGAPVDAQTVFRIGSVTKTFTATAIMQLRERGLLHLDDPLVRFVPEFGRARNPFGPIESVTIGRLLAHTAGLAWDPPGPEDATRYPFDRLSLEHILDAADAIVVETKPGRSWAYSNVGYQLLGAVVARVGGMSLADYLGTRILGPLGMTSTGFLAPGEPASRSAVGYEPAASAGTGERLTPARAVDPAWLGAAGGLASTLEDLARWVAFHLAAHGPSAAHEEVLGAASRRLMHRQTVLVDPAASRSQGLGWGGRHDGATPTIGHAGGLPGFSSFLTMSPAERVGVVVLVNGIPAVRDLPATLLRLALPAVLASREAVEATAAEAAELAGPAAPALPVPPAWLELLGDYRNLDMGDRLRVEVRDGGLVLYPPGEGGGPSEGRRLAATDDPLRFAIVDDASARTATVVFVRGADGRIGHLQDDGWPLVREAVPGSGPGYGPAPGPR